MTVPNDSPPGRRPNLVLVITDDQGYGDLGCTGNPWLSTPNIDEFHKQAIRLTDFHVSPLCTPTRAALMTGRRPLRTGAWATTWGRSLLRSSETTMAELFAASGYDTGLFGKWHLGDNYPYRPQDRGFQHVVAHKGGGVGQSSDFWGNNYFDDTYFHNGIPEAHKGYCTDIWFDEAIAFMETHREKPFFACITTNAPHSPYLVADDYKKAYLGNPDIPNPGFYGMIANIDENFGRLRARLAEWDLEDDTVLIFMTDNGSSGGCDVDGEERVTGGYNAGMRGKKGSYYEGGHRVPFFIRWPKGHIGLAGLNGYRMGGQDVAEMTLHVDLLPTLIELCDLEHPEALAFDGISLAGLLRGEPAGASDDRTHFIQYRQGSDPPEKWTNAVMTSRWRLVCGRELYDIKSDPGQQRNLTVEYPDVVARLRELHELWWATIWRSLEERSPIVLGSEEENPTTLCCFDVTGDVAWNQCAIAAAAETSGSWWVRVTAAGTYRFALRRWPSELNLPLDEALGAEEAAALAPYLDDITCRSRKPLKARLRIFGVEQVVEVVPGTEETVIEVFVPRAGVGQLDAWFIHDGGVELGAYYVTVARG